MHSEFNVDRRRFLATAAATGVAISSAPMVLGTEQKSGLALPVIGEGEFKYECIHDWGKDHLPAGHSYGGASHGVTIDRQGMIYITHHGNPGSIFVFDSMGKFVRSMVDDLRIDDPKSGNKVGRGHGIDIRTEGSEEFLYLSPNESSLPFCKINLKGEIVWKKTKQNLNRDSGVYDNPKTNYRPTNASFRPDGGYYLGDGYGSHYLFEYDAKDRFVRTIGGPGKENGKFQTPHGQWLDARDGTPKLVVADRANARLQFFSLNGEHLRTQDGFLFPADIDVQGDWMLVPDLHARVTILDKSSKVVAQLGDDVAWREKVLANNNAMRSKPELWLPGKFVHPHDACFDADGNIFVVEWVVGGRVTKLRKVS
ncbi:MAG: peptidase [Pirellula sp.]